MFGPFRPAHRSTKRGEDIPSNRDTHLQTSSRAEPSLRTDTDKPLSQDFQRVHAKDQTMSALDLLPLANFKTSVDAAIRNLATLTSSGVVGASKAMTSSDIDTLDTIVDRLRQAAIDAQLFRDQVKSAQLMERNSTVRINKLPFEVLAMIFLHIVGDRPLLTQDYLRIPRNIEYDLERTNKAAWRLTHVCKLWRDHTWAQPFLWNTIVAGQGTRYKRLPHADLLLVQSLKLAGKAPLNVRIECLDEVNPALFEELVERCDRIQSLRVETLGGQGDRLAMLSTEAPLLERMYVSGQARTLPPMFDNATPRLTHLALSGFLWPSSYAPATLTHLTLALQTYTNADEYKGLLGLLRQSGHSLRELSFESCSFPDRNTSAGIANTEPHDTIALPKLRQLAFRSCYAVLIAAVLHLLELPEHDLALDLLLWSPPEVPLTSILPSQLLTRGTRKPPRQPFAALEISLDRGLVVATQPAYRSALRLCNYQAFTVDMIDRFSSLDALLPLAALQALHYRGFYPGHAVNGHPSVWSLQSLFGALVSLTRLSLCLTRDNAKGLLQALVLPDGDERPYPVPALEELQIITDTARDRTALTALLAMLSKRHDAALGVRKLRVVCEADEGVADKRQLLKEWAIVREEFEQYVNELEFELVAERVQLNTPAPFLHSLPSLRPLY